MGAARGLHPDDVLDAHDEDWARYGFIHARAARPSKPHSNAGARPLDRSPRGADTDGVPRAARLGIAAVVIVILMPWLSAPAAVAVVVGAVMVGLLLDHRRGVDSDRGQA